MSNYRTALWALLFVAITTSEAAAPPDFAASGGPLCPPGQLIFREVEEPFTCTVLTPVSVPQKRPSMTIQHVRLRVPCVRTVIVSETQPVRIVRKVIREVPVQKVCTEMVYAPVFSRQVRTVLQEERKQVLVTCPVIVREECRELVTRKVIREVPVQKPCTRLVYVPVTTREPRERLVYAEVPVTMTRSVCVVRVCKKDVIDPGTGKKQTVEEPVCETKQVTETVKQYVLRNEIAVVPVTRYELRKQTCLETVKEYTPCWEQAVVNVTRYRKEMRTEQRTVKTYCLRPEAVTVKHYRLEPRTVLRTVKEYVPCWEEAVVPVTTYRMEKRACLETVDVYLPCKSEVIVQVTHLQPVVLRGTRKRLVIESAPAPGCGGAVGFSAGGFVAAAGAIGHAPWHGR